MLPVRLPRLKLATLPDDVPAPSSFSETLSTIEEEMKSHKANRAEAMRKLPECSSLEKRDWLDSAAFATKRIRELEEVAEVYRRAVPKKA